MLGEKSWQNSENRKVKCQKNKLTHFNIPKYTWSTLGGIKIKFYFSPTYILKKSWKQNNLSFNLKLIALG